jgi:hypothetical protein
MTDRQSNRAPVPPRGESVRPASVYHCDTDAPANRLKRRRETECLYPVFAGDDVEGTGGEGPALRVNTVRRRPAPVHENRASPGCHCEEPLRDAAIRSKACAVVDCRVAKQLRAMTGCGDTGSNACAPIFYGGTDAAAPRGRAWPLVWIAWHQDGRAGGLLA